MPSGDPHTVRRSVYCQAIRIPLVATGREAHLNFKTKVGTVRITSAAPRGLPQRRREDYLSGAVSKTV